MTGSEDDICKETSGGIGEFKRLAKGGILVTSSDWLSII
jgi:hypothetical protein